MLNNTFKGLCLALGLTFVIGCASSGVEVRRYVEVRDRVDQEMEGNAGFVGGEPQEVDRSHIRKTRKVYVMEVTEGDPIPENAQVVVESGEVDMADGNYATDGGYESDNYIEVSGDSAPEPFYDYPDDVDVGDTFESVATVSEYTVKKDDTLQKISKKFYNSYSMWPKIYEANRDVIDNPDRIKPGIVIQIPSQ